MIGAPLPRPLMGLTLIRPWSWCISDADKDIENRLWPPPRSIIGSVIAIHAGATYSTADAVYIRERYGLETPDREALLAGAVVALARVSDFVRSSDNRWFKGPFGWVLEERLKLKTPVPCRGNQRIWTVPDAVVAEIERQLGASTEAGDGPSAA